MNKKKCAKRVLRCRTAASITLSIDDWRCCCCCWGCLATDDAISTQRSVIWLSAVIASLHSCNCRWLLLHTVQVFFCLITSFSVWLYLAVILQLSFMFVWLCFFEWHFIDLFSCRPIAASLFNKLACLFAWGLCSYSSHACLNVLKLNDARKLK